MKRGKIERTDKKTRHTALPKISSGIPGFDEIAKGGIPYGRTTVVTGTSGSGKTVFATQFLYKGAVDEGENAVLVTFEEKPEDIIRNVKGFGWDIGGLVKQNKWAFVDATLSEDGELETGKYDLGALLARIEHAVKKVGAKRVAIDSIATLFARYKDESLVRGELYIIIEKLRKMGATTMITAERKTEREGISRFGVEEFVSDNVIVLSNALNKFGERERAVEVLKYRGARHDTFETPFAISVEGMAVFPKPVQLLEAAGFKEKDTCGIPCIDEMLRGGLYTNSATLLAGASGTGKTLMSIQFIKGALEKGRPCLYISSEESREQILSIARGFGWDLGEYERKGLLTFICWSPKRRGSLAVLRKINEIVEGKKIKRAVVDSLTAMRDTLSSTEFREFNRYLISYLKARNVTSMLTAATVSLMGAREITESHLSTMTDNIFLLRYVEVKGSLDFVVSILKTRGSDHDRRLWKYVIGPEGITTVEPMTAYEGILSGFSKKVGETTMEKLKKK